MESLLESDIFVAVSMVVVVRDDEEKRAVVVGSTCSRCSDYLSLIFFGDDVKSDEAEAHPAR